MNPISEQLNTHFDTMKLHFFRDHYQEVVQQAAKKQWTPEEVLLRLAEGEAQQRSDRACQRRIEAAHFPFLKSLDDFDWAWPRKINRAQIQHLFQLDWAKTHGNILFLGNVGLGKSHLALALSYQACQKGHSLRWTTAINMINTLVSAQEKHRLKYELKTFTRPDILAIDELGYMPIDKLAADLIFQVISERYERGSIIVTSNKAFKQWPTIFNNDATMTAAILDRVLHHGEPVLIEGKSYRMKDRIETE